MSCVRPFTVDSVRNVFTDEQVPIHCSHCQLCRHSALFSLVLRAKEEWKNSLGSSSFATMTYDDNHLYYMSNKSGYPFNLGLPTFDYSHLTKVLDSCFEYYHQKQLPPFKWLACFEYGENFFRPHIHLIAFGVPSAFLHKQLNNYWHFGFNDVDTLTDGGITYVCKYLMKQVNGDLRDRLFFDKNLNPPKVCFSKGLGSSFFAKRIDDIRKYGAIKYGSHFFPVPSYYKRKYQDLDISHQEFLYDKSLELYNKKYGNYAYFGYKDMKEFEQRSNENKELNYIKKMLDKSYHSYAVARYHSPFVAKSVVNADELYNLVGVC